MSRNPSNTLQPVNFVLEPDSATRLGNLCGPLNQNLKQIEKTLEVKISNRGTHFCVEGEAIASADTVRVIHSLYQQAQTNELTPSDIHICIHTITHANIDKESFDPLADKSSATSSRIGKVLAYGKNQTDYIEKIKKYDLTFGVGPAGTGKTFLAVAAAVDALLHQRVKHLVLVRPAVEAGERLGFLPGDLAQKVDPYLRPIYDSLYALLGFERVNKMVARGEIDVAPLAYMRGCSLNNAFIILDEAQNTTAQQMKMFLTRIGFDSKVVVTGDVTQIDLPASQKSGLQDALQVLKGISGIGFTFFDVDDVIRHRLVKAIVVAYDKR
ncbi:MAG: PhoH family protein [Candidatus Oxydemutatoraceae bacterium WSBS_2016_MAG_OTU14]